MRSIGLLSCALTFGCASPNITNRTASTQTRASTYPIEAQVEPRGTTIQSVDADFDGHPYPLMRVGTSDVYRGDYIAHPCESVLSFKVDVRYQRSGSQSVSTKTAPTGAQTFLSTVTGAPPPGCPTSYGRVIEVDTFQDLVDLDPADGICAGAGGACSLRAAVQEANATSAHDIIKAPGGIYVLMLTGSETIDVPDAQHGDLDITASVSIMGVGGRAIVDGASASRLFDVHALDDDAFVELAMLELRNGRQADQPGGALKVSGETYVRDVRFVDNAVANSNISGSCAAFPDKRACNRGGAIFNEAKLTIEDSLIENNHTCGPQTTGNCGGNTGHAGAISNFETEADLTVRRSLIQDNSARFVGGVMNYLGRVRLVNSTLFDHTGAWASHVYTKDGSIALDHVTVIVTGSQTSMHATSTGASTTISLQSSVVYSDSFTGGDLCSVTGGPNILTLGNNRIGGFSSTADYVGSCPISLGGSDATGGISMDATPSNNGGPTATVRLRASATGSRVAIVDDGSTKCPPTDQRGVLRPRDGDSDGDSECDPGAFEL